MECKILNPPQMVNNTTTTHNNLLHTYPQVGKDLEAVGALSAVVLGAEVVHQCHPGLEGALAASLMGTTEEPPGIALHYVQARVLGGVHRLHLLSATTVLLHVPLQVSRRVQRLGGSGWVSELTKGWNSFPHQTYPLSRQLIKHKKVPSSLYVEKTKLTRVAV